MEIKSILEKFESLYSSRPILFKSPGRINLIGEHTDYNDGFVLPAAIDKAILFAIGKNKVKKIRLYAYDLKESYETDLKEVEKTEVHWANYLLGVVAQFQKAGKKITGIDCVFGGDIPIGAGLSSSAAIESGFAFGLNDIFKLEIPKLQLAQMAQMAEHEFAGVKCGIMDQFTSFFGKKNHVLQLDCRSLEHKFFSLELKDHTIVLCDTQVKHSLATSEYNLRREECELGVTVMQQFEPFINSLRDVDIIMLNSYKSKLDSHIYKRCKYVIEENRRVIESGIALQNQNLKLFGELLYKSHYGLKNEYEVSCKELDFLVEIAENTNSVVGARMMGGGFGGCTINLVQHNGLDSFIEKINLEYYNEYKIKPLIYMVNTADGVGKINMNTNN